MVETIDRGRYGSTVDIVFFLMVDYSVSSMCWRLLVTGWLIVDIDCLMLLGNGK